MDRIAIPGSLISDYAALGLTVPTLPDQFGELSSMLTNEYDSSGPLFYWSALGEPPSGARLIFQKWVSSGTLAVEFLISAALGAKTAVVLTTASGNAATLQATFSDGTTSTVFNYPSGLNFEGDITFTATSTRVITKITLSWPTGSSAGISISRIVLDD